MDGNWLIQPGLVIAWYLGFASSLLAGQLAKAPRRGTLQALLLKEIDRVIDAHQDPIKSVLDSHHNSITRGYAFCD